MQPTAKLEHAFLVRMFWQGASNIFMSISLFFYAHEISPHLCHAVAVYIDDYACTCITTYLFFVALSTRAHIFLFLFLRNTIKSKTLTYTRIHPPLWTHIRTPYHIFDVRFTGHVFFCITWASTFFLKKNKAYKYCEIDGQKIWHVHYKLAKYILVM
jgi:hypothetical protein